MLINYIHTGSMTNRLNTTYEKEQQSCGYQIYRIQELRSNYMKYITESVVY